MTGLFVILFFAMRYATAGSKVFWSGEASPSQLRWIAIMLGSSLAIHLAANTFIALLGSQIYQYEVAVYYFAWAVIPAAFLAAGVIKWPSRLASASKLRLRIIGGAALVFASAVSIGRFQGYSGVDGPSSIDLLGAIFNLIGAAAVEEIAWRVLLLTAILDLTKSRFNAVFLSSVIFGLLHAPLALLLPVVQTDWPMLLTTAEMYAPNLLVPMFMGIILGLIWLRSGSISLIVITHSILNFGPRVFGA